MKLLDCRVPYVVALFLLTSNSNAEPAVDAGAALRDMDRRLPPPAAQRSPDSLQLDTPAQRLGGNVRVDVRIFNIIGNSQLATEECQSIVKPWLGSQRTFRDLSDAASALATAYRARGLLAAIQFPPQDVTDGIVTIQIVESRFGQVHLDVPVSSADALVTLAQSSLQQEQVRGQPLQVQVLERATRLLTEIPGLSASVRLAAGELPDETDVWVSAASRSSVRGAVSVDNAGNKSIGANALSGVLVWDNYLGQGESVHAQVQASRGLRALRGGLSLPAGSHGWRLGAELAGLRYRLLNEFSALDGTGDIRSIALWAQVPLTREPTMDSNFRAELGAQHSRNLIQGASISDKRGESLSLTWDWQRTGDTVFPDSSRWRLQGKAGRLDLSGQAANLVADQSGPKTNGTFAKLSFSYSGVRRMDAVTDLQLHVSGQLAAKNLDAAEQLNMGGPEAVRAFGSNDTSGDAGIFARWELVRHVNHEVEISTFVDQGLLRLRRFPEPVSTSAPNSRNLLGFGAGLRWALPGGTDVHAELSRGVLPDPSSQDQLSSRPESGPRGVRLWVHASLRF